MRIFNILKNHNLVKVISEVSWHEFRRWLEYKVIWYDRDIIIALSNYGSSQLCSDCGYKNSDKLKFIGVISYKLRGLY